MKQGSTTRAPATAALLYWLVLVAGLALLTVARIDDLDSLAPIWAGSVCGTALGQLMAWRRLRLWLAAFLTVNLFWLVPVAALFVWGSLNNPLLGVAFTRACFLSFVAAALCGYFSLSERGGLFAFWFPAVPWMLSILDRTGGRSLVGASWLVPGALAGLLLAFLHARETRRIALWQGHADFRLAVARRPVVLREAPLRSLGRHAWMAAASAATVLMAATVAPHLWHREELRGRPMSHAVARADGLAAAGSALPCCSEPTSDDDAPQVRVQEYLPVVPPNADQRSGGCGGPRPDCVRCTRGGVPLTTVAAGEANQGEAGGSTVGTSDQAVDGLLPSRSVEPALPIETSAVAAGPRIAAERGAMQPHRVEPTPQPAQPSPPPPANRNPVAIEAKPAAPPPPPAAPVVEPATVPAAGVVAPPPAARPIHLEPPPRSPAAGDEPLRLQWLLMLVVAMLALHLLARPLRRSLTLWHLRRPLWPETVEQRVSNLWQLVLVGLRDAGWQVAPGEQPQQLARRIGLRGLSTCALVLERARHGVRVEAEDLDAMGRAARLVYHEARAPLGWLARAASWLRWPLT